MVNVGCLFLDWLLRPFFVERFVQVCHATLRCDNILNGVVTLGALLLLRRYGGFVAMTIRLAVLGQGACTSAVAAR